jgi:SET domain-containing protein 6
MTSTYYSLEMYHIMGSRILSRSFNVERWDSGEDEEENPAANTSHGSGMDVDSPQGAGNGDESHHTEPEDEEEDDDDGDDSSDVAMVPMADMLNARYGSENVRSHRVLPSNIFLIL